jgi:hypothetical protein
MPALATEMTKEAAWAGVESGSLEHSIELENRQQRCSARRLIIAQRLSASR